METEDLCQGEADCLRSDKPHGKSRQTKHLTGEQEWEEYKKKKEGREVRDRQRWRDRDGITKAEKVGGFLQMMKTRDLHCVRALRMDGSHQNALQTHGRESGHRGVTRRGIITFFVLP